MKKKKTNKVGNILLLTLWLFISSVGLSAIIVILFPDEPPAKVGGLNILPDEVAKYGPNGYDPFKAPKEKKTVRYRVKRNKVQTEWDDLRDIIENYSEDTWDVENAIEDLRREQEEVKEVIRKIKKQQARRNNGKEFWTLENREL